MPAGQNGRSARESAPRQAWRLLAFHVRMACGAGIASPRAMVKKNVLRLLISPRSAASQSVCRERCRVTRVGPKPRVSFLAEGRDLAG